MKNLTRIMAAAAFVLVSTASLGQEQGTGLKIAILDMNRALFNSDVAIEVDEEVRAETAEDQQEVRQLAEDAQELQDQLEQDGAVLSEAEQRRITGEIQEIGNQYQFLVQKIQTIVEERRQQFQQTYSPNLVQAISEVVEEEGYDIVFRSEVALHFRNAYDITARVTEKLNQQQ